MRISERSDILRFLDPINKFEELENFIAAKGEYNPIFSYDDKHIPILTEVLEYIEKLKTKSEKLRIKLWEKGYKLRCLMIEKCEELECKFQLLKAYHEQDMKMIQAYNEQLFWTQQHQNISSLQKYAQTLEDKYRITIESMLPKNSSFSASLNKKELITLISYHLKKNKINRFRIKFGPYGNTNMQVSIWPTAVIYVNKKKSYSLYDSCVSILHEIYGHLARYAHGVNSWIHLLQWWTAYYLRDEEGLAVFQAARLEWITQVLPRLEANYKLIYEASLYNRSELTQRLILRWQTNLEHIFRTLLRLKRWLVDTSKTGVGIAFYKDKVYRDGYCQIINYLSNHRNKLDNLMIWRIWVNNIG